jgi:hypothetical protein
MPATYKANISLDSNIWQQLQQRQNQDDVINRALGLFFNYEKSVESADEKENKKEFGVLYPLPEEEITELDKKLIKEIENTPQSKLHNI